MSLKILIPTLLITFNSFSQIHLGSMGGYNFESDKTQLGAGINLMVLPKVSLGAMAMITPFDDENSDHMIMYNVKYKLGNFHLVGGLMDMDMDMDMDMNSLEPYIGLEFRPFKNKMLKIYYNHSDVAKSIGIMLPILNIGKKKMNHMNHISNVHCEDKGHSC